MNRFMDLRKSQRLPLDRTGKSRSPVRHSPAIIVLAVLLSSVVLPPVHAASTTGDERITNLGPNHDIMIDNWRQDGNCTSTRTWNAAADSFCFNWNTGGQDQIGRIGRRFENQGYPQVKVEDVRDACIMSTTASMTNLNTGSWYMWTIYGWTATTNSFNARHNEFYVVFQSTYSPGGYESIGSVTIDGVQFDCYRLINMGWDPGRNQYMAICKSGTWGGAAKPSPWSGNFSVDMKKMFAFWRSKGLENEIIVEMTWAIEGYSGSSGIIQMSNLVIPYIAKTGTAELTPALPNTHAPLQTPFSFFDLSGRRVPDLRANQRPSSAPQMIQVGK